MVVDWYYICVIIKLHKAYTRLKIIPKSIGAGTTEHVSLHFLI